MGRGRWGGPVGRPGAGPGGSSSPDGGGPSRRPVRSAVRPGLQKGLRWPNGAPCRLLAFKGSGRSPGEFGVPAARSSGQPGRTRSTPPTHDTGGTCTCHVSTPQGRPGLGQKPLLGPRPALALWGQGFSPTCSSFLGGCWPDPAPHRAP